MASSSVTTLAQHQEIYLKQLGDPSSSFLTTMAKKERRCVLKSQPNGLSKEYEISCTPRGDVATKQLKFFKYRDVTVEQADKKIIDKIKAILLGKEYIVAVCAQIANSISGQQNLMTEMRLNCNWQVCDILYQYRLRTDPPMSELTSQASCLTFHNPVFLRDNLTEAQLCELAKSHPSAAYALCSSPLFDQTNCDINLILLDTIQNRLSSVSHVKCFMNHLPAQCLIDLMSIKEHREIIFSLLPPLKIKLLPVLLIARLHSIQSKESQTKKIALPDVELRCLKDTDEETFRALMVDEVWQLFSCSSSFGENLNLLLSNKAPFKKQYSLLGKKMHPLYGEYLIRTFIISRVVELNPEAISQLKDANQQYLEYDIVSGAVDTLLSLQHRKKSYAELLKSWIGKLQLPHLNQTNQCLYTKIIEKLRFRYLNLAIQFYLPTSGNILESSKNTFLLDLIFLAWASDDISEQDFLNLLMSMSMVHHSANDLINKLGLSSRNLLSNPVHFGKLCLFIHWMGEKQSKYLSIEILASMVKQIETFKAQSTTQNYPTDYLACFVAAFNTINDENCKIQIQKLFQILTVSEIASLLRSGIFRQPIPIAVIQSLYQDPPAIDLHNNAFFNALSAEQQVLVIRELIADKDNINDIILAKELVHSMPADAQSNTFSTDEFSILASTA